MKLIILDRDGVINHDSTEYIKSVDEWQAIPGSLQAISNLSRNGYRIVVATNQAGLARGKLNIESLNAIHRKMQNHLLQFGGKIEAIFFCPHGPNDGCKCRKPKPGLYTDIARRLNVLLDEVYAVGDSLTDIDAAISAGARPILVKTGNGQSIVDKEEVPENVPVYDDLAEFVDTLLAQE
ncbi:MAG: D-glycero-beta-D-manno-heptose 1,7-bisphosphate 7-phosphatase [Gammaproteobacteria bacterium]|nr:D-glycero-beta-D-manno-heptose 1,7-bisphosphate 7-phosphatase [Gammaproteobacteria bacterium]